MKEGEAKEERCKPCNGTGVQILKSGLKIECPNCDGTGKKRLPRKGWL